MTVSQILSVSNSPWVPFGSTATQSSMQPAAGNPHGDKAIDGFPTPSFQQNSCTMTQEDDEAWWLLDMKTIVDVQIVRITNRDGQFYARMV